MSQLQKYRSRMRRNALRVIGGLYLLVVTPMLLGYFRGDSKLSVDVVAVSIGYGFMALIALMLMSLISPPGGSVAEEPEGIGFTKE